MEVVERIAVGLSPKARENFIAFMKTLDQIKEEEDYRYIADFDGIACLMACDILDIQQEKMMELQEEMKGIFLPEDEKYPIVLVAGRNINAQGVFGFTELHVAVMDHNLTLVIELVSLGIDKSIRDNSGHTAYDKAMRFGFDDLLEILDLNI